MQFYGERPINNYSRPARRQSKNYTTIQNSEPRNLLGSKSRRKHDNIYLKPNKDNEKQNAIPNCKSTVHIQFVIENNKSKHERQRSNSFLNKSQIFSNNMKTQNNIYQNTQRKIKARSRWETAQYKNQDYNKNYEIRLQDNDITGQRYKNYNNKLRTYQKFKSIDMPETYKSTNKMPTPNLDSYNNQYNLKKYWVEQEYKLPQYKSQITDIKASNTPFYERIKDFSSTTPTFRSDEDKFMSQTISFQSSDGKLLFMSQSLGGNKSKQLYDNIDFKTEAYSPRLKNQGNLAKSMIAKTQSTKDPDLNDFIIGECKGEGRFGKVYMAVHKKTGFLCALKKIKKQSVKYMIDQFIQQIKIQLYLNHPKLVKVYGYFADKEYFYMLVEYMEEGSLYSLMKKSKKLQEVEAAEKLFEICQGIKEMHEQNIVHRDLKPQNVVMTNGVCKICDFGWAAICQDRRQTYCGTLDYVCPQIVQGNAYDSSADIWCIGVLAYQLMCGKAPFYDISRQKTIQKIKSCKIDTFPSHLSKKAVRFIQMILKKNPDSRVGVSELLNSDFLRLVRK